MPERRRSRFLAYRARFFEWGDPEEREEGGELTENERSERGAMEGGAALGETATALKLATARATGGCGFLPKRDRESGGRGFDIYETRETWGARHEARSRDGHERRRRR